MALNTTNHSVNAYSYNFVTTMAQNLEMFTRRQQQKIADAKRLYELLGRPSHARFVKIMITGRVRKYLNQKKLYSVSRALLAS
eukprot:scaffold13345_cov76-Cylindrotheca_fusiformis.AAC.1